MPTTHHSVFLQAGCPSSRPTNSIKALKANKHKVHKTCRQSSSLPTQCHTPSQCAVSNNTGGNNTHTHPFNGPFSGTTRVSWYQKGKTNLDYTEARDSEWQWHQLGRTQVCTSLQTDNHASTPPLSFLQAGVFKKIITTTTLPVVVVLVVNLLCKAGIGFEALKNCLSVRQTEHLLEHLRTLGQLVPHAVQIWHAGAT